MRVQIRQKSRRLETLGILLVVLFLSTVLVLLLDSRLSSFHYRWHYKKKTTPKSSFLLTQDISWRTRRDDVCFTACTSWNCQLGKVFVGSSAGVRLSINVIFKVFGSFRTVSSVSVIASGRVSIVCWFSPFFDNFQVTWKNQGTRQWRTYGVKKIWKVGNLQLCH